MFNTINEAKTEAMKLSEKNPGTYYTLYSCFGIFIQSSKRLHVFAPSDSCYPAYWHNGIEKPFSTAQIANDWANTPTMS